MLKQLFKKITVAAALAAFFFYPFTYESEKTDLAQQDYYLVSADIETPQKYICTAYDLSYQSCEKLPDHSAYGITANGTSLKNHSRTSAMAVAVDPEVIPLGSDVLIVFKDERAAYSGIYKAVDTGGAIQGNRIDIFFGDNGENVSQEALNFGRAEAEVYVL